MQRKYPKILRKIKARVSTTLIDKTIALKQLLAGSGV